MGPASPKAGHDTSGSFMPGIVEDTAHRNPTPEAVSRLIRMTDPPLVKHSSGCRSVKGEVRALLVYALAHEPGVAEHRTSISSHTLATLLSSLLS